MTTLRSCLPLSQSGSSRVTSGLWFRQPQSTIYQQSERVDSDDDRGSKNENIKRQDRPGDDLWPGRAGVKTGRVNQAQALVFYFCNLFAGQGGQGQVSTCRKASAQKYPVPAQHQADHPDSDNSKKRPGKIILKKQITLGKNKSCRFHLRYLVWMYLQQLFI